MNLRIITKNHAADPEIGFLTKSSSKPYGHATGMPPAWELIIKWIISYASFFISENCFLSVITGSYT